MAITATFTLDPIARWESKTGKYWVALFSDGVSAWYNSDNGVGSLGKITNDAAAIATMQTKVDTGYFLPDTAKTPMRKVI